MVFFALTFSSDDPALLAAEIERFIAELERSITEQRDEESLC
jgi:hypothetical protein